MVKCDCYGWVDTFGNNSPYKSITDQMCYCPFCGNNLNIDKNKCSCIGILNKRIKEKTGDPNAMVESSVMFNFNTGKETLKFKPIYAHYRKKNKGGEFVKRPSKTHFSLVYCPICGLKY